MSKGGFCQSVVFSELLCFIIHTFIINKMINYTKYFTCNKYGNLKNNSLIYFFCIANPRRKLAYKNFLWSVYSLAHGLIELNYWSLLIYPLSLVVMHRVHREQIVDQVPFYKDEKEELIINFIPQWFCGLAIIVAHPNMVDFSLITQSSLGNSLGSIIGIQVNQANIGLKRLEISQRKCIG